MKDFPKKITFGEKYGPAMKITDPEEAKEYFDACVRHNMSFGDHSREKAETFERQSLGYYAGYYDTKTRLRVEKLFNCTHPIFGKAAEGVSTSEEALAAGFAAAKGAGVCQKEL